MAQQKVSVKQRVRNVSKKHGVLYPCPARCKSTWADQKTPIVEPFIGTKAVGMDKGAGKARTAKEAGMTVMWASASMRKVRPDVNRKETTVWGVLAHDS